MAIRFDLELSIKNLFVPPRAQQISMLVMEPQKCSLKKPNQGYCMATLWTQNYGWGEKYESVSWCHAGCQCVVYCGEWCFLTEQREPPSPPSPALLHLHWMRESLPFSPSQIVQTEDISDSTQFITFRPAFQTNTHTQNEYCQPVTAKKILKYFICS